MQKFTILTWIVGVGTLLWLSVVKLLILNIYSIINTFAEKKHEHENPETRFEIIKFTLDTYRISRKLLGAFTLGMYKFHFRLRFEMLEFERDYIWKYKDQVQIYNEHFFAMSLKDYVANLVKKDDISLFDKEKKE